jgi:hypothetical protein
MMIIKEGDAQGPKMTPPQILLMYTEWYVHSIPFSKNTGKNN